MIEKEVLTLKEAEEKGLTYLIRNLYVLSEGHLTSINFFGSIDNIAAIGTASLPTGMAQFQSGCTYDGSKVTIKSYVVPENGEAFNVIDTFYLEADNIRVVSAVPYEDRLLEKYIPYISAHLGR